MLGETHKQYCTTIGVSDESPRRQPWVWTIQESRPGRGERIRMGVIHVAWGGTTEHENARFPLLKGAQGDVPQGAGRHVPTGHPPRPRPLPPLIGGIFTG